MEGTPIEFLVDAGAGHSVLLDPWGKLSSKTSWVQGATGMKKYSWTTRRNLDLSTGQVSHSFMVIQDCPYPLLGQDLLTKIGAQIHFSPEGVNVMDLAGRPVQDLTMQMSTDYTKAPPK